MRKVYKKKKKLNIIVKFVPATWKGFRKLMFWPIFVESGNAKVPRMNRLSEN